MYIHSIHKQINEKKETKEYRKELKILTDINLRRSNKFNILAVLGALKCTNNIILSENIGIYVASEYGPINDVYNIMKTVCEDNYLVMPFDFLNINSNNVSFYVSQALKAKGKNTLLTSRYLSFEKSLLLAKFDLNINEVDDVLIGGVDESLLEINDFNKYLDFPKFPNSKEGSCWFYLNKEKLNSLGQITNITEFNSYEILNQFLNKSYDNIALNQFANLDEKIISSIDKSKLIEDKNFYGSEGALHLFNLLQNKGNHLYLAKDNKQNFIAIELKV